MEDDDMKEIPDSHAAEGKVLSEPENEDFGADMDRPKLTSSALKKGLQAADDLLKQFFEVDHFTD
jgi:hypothetical protein